MAKGARYRLMYRRRREQKTDYEARRTLATSTYPRFVVRTTNKGINVQVIKSEIKGDIVMLQSTTHELINKFGWQVSGKNIPASYLIGYLTGKKAVEAGIEHAHLDLGLKRPTKGSKVFAAVKGAIDAGLVVPCDSDVIPSPERLSGKDIAQFAQEMDDAVKYEKLFSIYLKRGIRPENLPEHFDVTKNKIQEELVK